MKFSDLPNPAAARELINKFRDRFSAKVCLAPTRDCQGSIISAHTISVGAMLRPISRNNQVYSVETDLYNSAESGPVKFGLKGLRQTSVFNGFCSHHDKVLFAPIEDEPFACSQKQLFIHAYRAVAKESYLKRKQAETNIPPEVIKQIHGLPDALPLEYSDLALLAQAATLRGAEEIEATKAKMDQYYIDEAWNRVMTTVIPFSGKPTMVCNFIYQPDFDFDGEYLQDFEDLTTDLSQLMVTVIPYNGGGLALLSHLDTANAAPRKLVSSLIKQPDITSAVASLIVCQTENFAISPDWFDGLSQQERDNLLKVFTSNTDLFDSAHNILRGCPIKVSTWHPGRPFTI